MPRILTSNSCQEEYTRRAKATLIPTTELNKIPTHDQLRPRLNEQVCNAAYYEWFMQKQPTLEYEDDTGGKILYADNMLVYVNSNDEYPFKGLYKIRPATFLNTPSCQGIDLWWLPNGNESFEDVGFTFGLTDACHRLFINDYAHKIFIDKFNTISMVSHLSELLRAFSYPAIQYAFNRGNYVYVTTEEGTTRLQSLEDLVISQIWGTDPIFGSRYVSLSKLDLLSQQ